MSNWGHLTQTDRAKFDDFFDKYVPINGSADTLGGEIVRAINRIVYRYDNDGDTVDRYCGNEYNHLRACDTFLKTYCPAYHSLSNVKELEYEKNLCDRLKKVLDYLIANPNVFEIPNSTDCIANAPYEPWEYDDDEDYDYDDDEDYDYDDDEDEY